MVPRRPVALVEAQKLTSVGAQLELRKGTPFKRSTRLISVLALLVVFSGYAVGQGVREESGLAAGFLSFTAFLCLAALLGYIAKKTARTSRVDASRRLELMVGPYILWLRPFAFDLSNVVRYKNIFDSTSGSKIRATLEELVATACLHFRIGLRSIGAKDVDHALISVSEKFEGEAWQNAVRDHMKKSSLIFLVPSFSEGTFWEISQIVADGLTEKTVMIMPTSGMIYSSHAAVDIQEHWKQTAERVLSELRFFEKGALFAWVIDNGRAKVEIIALTTENIAALIQYAAEQGASELIGAEQG